MSFAITHHHRLRTLHNNRLIHRDIKPSNLLVNAQGLVKIADFGVATFADTCNLANSSIGTKLFMSPERIKLSDYSYQSDMWSFGMSPCLGNTVSHITALSQQHTGRTLGAGTRV